MTVCDSLVEFGPVWFVLSEVVFEQGSGCVEAGRVVGVLAWVEGLFSLAGGVTAGTLLD